MSFVEKFLAERPNPTPSYCEHSPVSILFRLTGGAAVEEFVLRLADGEAVATVGGGAADITVECSLAEFEDVVEGRKELMGPFWEEYLPADFTFAGALSGFLFFDHPYRGLNPVIDEIYTTSRFYPTITPFPQAYRLHQLIVEEKLGLSFEIGLAFGASGLIMADAHRRNGFGHHFAADPFQTGSFFNGEGLAHLERSGLGPHLSWLNKRARPALDGFKRAGVEFDLIYIDGDHTVAAVLSDFMHADSVLREGGYLAFDDSHMPSGVKLLPMIREQFEYEDVPDRSTDRFTVLRKQGHKTGSIALKASTAVADIGVPTLEWTRNTMRRVRRRPHH